LSYNTIKKSHQIFIEMMIKNKKRKITARLVLFILIIILDLAFLFFNKYRNQNLNLNDFYLFNIGNLINILLAILLIVGLIIIKFKKLIVLNSKIFFPFFLLNQLLLIALYFLKQIPWSFKGIYYLGQTGDELLIGAVFTLYIVTFLVMIFLVWLNIFNYKNILILRTLLNSSLTIIFILLSVFIYIVVKEANLKEYVIQSDAKNLGVVLGAAVWSGNKPSPTLTSRIEQALKLYKQHKISQIYLTGSNAPGELSESEVALEYIKNKGIKTSDIFIEKETTSTNEQIQYIKKKLLPTSKKSIVVISDSYHLVRVLEIAKFQGIKIQVSASEHSLSFEKAVYSKIRESLALTMFWLYGL